MRTPTYLFFVAAEFTRLVFLLGFVHPEREPKQSQKLPGSDVIPQMIKYASPVPRCPHQTSVGPKQKTATAERSGECGRRTCLLISEPACRGGGPGRREGTRPGGRAPGRAWRSTRKSLLGFGLGPDTIKHFFFKGQKRHQINHTH